MFKLFALIVISLFVTLSAAAQEEAYCAAVYPCNKDGTVYAPFNKGACYTYYQLICLKGETLRDLDKDLQECEASKDRLKNKVRRLRRKLRRLG